MAEGHEERVDGPVARRDRRDARGRRGVRLRVVRVRGGAALALALRAAHGRLGLRGAPVHPGPPTSRSHVATRALITSRTLKTRSEAASCRSSADASGGFALPGPGRPSMAVLAPFLPASPPFPPVPPVPPPPRPASRESACAGQGWEVGQLCKPSYLGRCPLVLAHFLTSDHLSGRTQSVDAFLLDIASRTPTLKRL